MPGHSDQFLVHRGNVVKKLQGYVYVKVRKSPRSSDPSTALIDIEIRFIIGSQKHANPISVCHLAL